MGYEGLNPESIYLLRGFTRCSVITVDNFRLQLMSKMDIKSFVCAVLLLPYSDSVFISDTEGRQVKKQTQLEGVCSTRGRDVKRIQNFSRKT
jgi:hypothetical protein